jgi:hypothetical protein
MFYAYELGNSFNEFFYLLFYEETLTLRFCYELENVSLIFLLIVFSFLCHNFSLHELH